jgi:hypothetical protein
MRHVPVTPAIVKALDEVTAHGLLALIEPFGGLSDFLSGEGHRRPAALSK